MPLIALLVASSIHAQEAPADPPEAKPSVSTNGAQETGDTAATLDDVMQMLKTQQSQLDAQKKLLEQQAQRIADLQALYDKTKQNYDQKAARQSEIIDAQVKVVQAMQAKIDELSQFDPTAMSNEEKQLRQRLETVESSIESNRSAASTQFDEKSFPGALPLPGTAAALRIGGFVKANALQNFGTIGSQGRFIVGTISTDPGQQGDRRTELTVSQSRLNFDLRDNASNGTLRAFIEGDFAGQGDTFRLRHAFGQFKDVLVGKTYSVFVDEDANPEEIDYEGINGRINVRQTQLRWFPQIGKDLNLILSLEDPVPAIQNGSAISEIPDVVASVRREWFHRWHVKTAVIVRQIEGRWSVDDTVTDDVGGWGVTVSGKTAVSRWDQRDNLMFQVNYGKGYGRYVNDLGSVGGGDAVFDSNGKLYALPVFAGFAAFQKWWNEGMRSTFIASFVHVDDYDFQQGDSYANTRRLSGNLIFSPTPRIDLGGEVIWGRRENKDTASGTAVQLQVSGKYRF